jgi:hypothetical protein
MYSDTCNSRYNPTGDRSQPVLITEEPQGARTKAPRPSVKNPKTYEALKDKGLSK